MHWTVPSIDAARAVAAPEWMAVVWFIILGGLLAVYAMLDGFDLGVGIVHFFAARGSEDRSAHMNAIGPVWDGNEVWLVVFGGALFAAFPLAYATLFSAFYLPLIVLLFCLIVRAASIELRHVFHAPWWKGVCDLGFFGASLLATAIFGIAVGVCMVGLPLNESGEFAPAVSSGASAPTPTESVLVLISPFSVAVGALAVALCAVHGAAFLGLHAQGAHAQRCRRVGLAAWCVFVALVLLVTVLAVGRVPAATRNFADAPWLVVVAALGGAATLWALRGLLLERPWTAFVGTCLMAFALVSLFMAALFPDMVIDAQDPARSIHLVTAASSKFTLLMMFFVVLVAAPLIAAYTLITYSTFHGRPRGDGAHSGIYQ
jgi:cytochrome d ubiquinol oxidase subunit II